MMEEQIGGGGRGEQMTAEDDAPELSESLRVEHRDHAVRKRQVELMIDIWTVQICGTRN